MKYQLGCQLDYQLTEASTFFFNIGVMPTARQQIVQETAEATPNAEIEEYSVPQIEGRFWRVQWAAGTVGIHYQAVVDVTPEPIDPTALVEVPPAALPPETWTYLYPSRYCPSDHLLSIAQEQFGHLAPGYSRVAALCDWIHDAIAYESGSTDVHTSALDVWQQRAGVCRDFAHLGIAFCRSLNIPARFVSAYAYGLNPPDFHACFEAYLGDRWCLFDPTHLVPTDSIVRIGLGRDAADVSFATIFGPAEMLEMRLTMQPADAAQTPPQGSLKSKSSAQPTP